MPKISLIVSEYLHQQLLITMQEMDLDNVSDTVRLLLHTALEAEAPDTSNHKLQKRAASYSIMAYCLMEKFLATSVKNGQDLSNEAHDKAEKLINSLTPKFSSK